jgi:hypothetical protein
MEKEEALKENFINMRDEYQMNNRKISRKIDSIFFDEIKHFNFLIRNFNSNYRCINESDIYLLLDRLKEIFNSAKVILVEDYQSRFQKNMDELTLRMYDFFMKKLNHKEVRCPTSSINKCLNEMCKFDLFLIEDKLENELIDLANEVNYRYINSDEARKDFDAIIKNLNYSLLCDLKKAISISIEDKQDITLRYNSLNKELINAKSNQR